jgi:hypothetical protein
MQISFANSCPVVVTQSGQGEDVPGSVAFHIVPGVHESSQLTEIFRILRGSNVVDVGALGREYVRQHSDHRLVAQQLSAVLQSCAPQVSYVMEKWDALRKKAQKALVAEVQELVIGNSRIEAVDPFEQVIRPAISELGW